MDLTTDSDTKSSTTCSTKCGKKEQMRLQTVLDYDLENFDIEDKGLKAITTLASIICQTQMSFITLVGNSYVDFLSRVGSLLTGTGRQNSFCDLAIEQDQFFEVCDSTEDIRFQENVFVKGQTTPLKYYGGYPLKTPSGFNLGSLCVCDLNAMKLNQDQILALKTLADQVVVHLELRKQNKLLKAALEKAAKLSKAKDEFVANISHELRTPLNAINGFADAVLKTSLDREQKEALGIIKSSSDILITLINDILDFSKMESGKLAIDKQPFNLRKAMKHVKDLLSQKALDKGNTLSFYIDESVPDKLMGDKVRLNQVIINLVGNALKFTENGSVKLSVYKVAESEKSISMKFSISDTGIGIPEQKLESIFERFEQVGKETQRKFGGTGLGLNISKNIIALHNGELKVKSELGKGSEFYFTIDYDVVNEEELLKNNLEPTNLEKLKKVENLKILICEDNVVNIKLIKNLFKNKLSSIEIAENGKIAISILEKVKDFDVILMDIHMPEMDGLETTKYIRNVLNSKIPIIGFTANSSKSERDRCLSLGMDDYITKTFVSEEFYERLSKALPFKKKFQEDDIFEKLKTPKRKINSQIYVNKLKQNDTAKNSIQLKKTNYSSKNVKMNFNKFKEDSKNDADYSIYSENKNDHPKYYTIEELSNGPSANDSDYDSSCIKDFSAGDKQFEKELIEIFLEEFSSQMDFIGKAVKEKDIQNIKFYVHKIKTPLTMLGFTDMLNELKKIENMMQNNTEFSVEIVNKIFESANAQQEEIQTKLKKYLLTIRKQ
jgi:signal transduction histidine kinase/DNA-binding response OmpR family regulator/HPt (histidine-containing phosphotransfer) domain-containing protein